MSRSESRQRTVLVGVRFTPGEYAWLAGAASERGLTVQDLLREPWDGARMLPAGTALPTVDDGNNDLGGTP